MAKLKDQELLDVYYEINNKDAENNAFNTIRKATVFKYSVALNTLDNRNTCLLLNEDLKKHPSTKIISDEDMNTMISRNRCRQFGLDKSNAISHIANLACSGKPVCEKSENISEEQFQEFLSLFQEKRSRSAVTEQRQRTYMKNYVNPVQCVKEDAHSDTNKLSSFKTAREEMNLQTKQAPNATGLKRKLGTRRGVTSKFVSPLLSNGSNEDSTSKSQEWDADHIEDDRLKNFEPRMIELIKSEIMDKGPPIDWNDIAGLEAAKTAIQEAVVWPMLRPDIFTGLRRPPKGILLFGPPGTGKTLIGKCVASQSKSTFFSISASSLTSKWVGEGEKMVRALFAVARCNQPAVIFIDEIDSLLSQRSETEHESSRRIKTEFLVQLDGATTDNDEKLLVIGATNRPQELDEAARRRFVKRLYIPLPELQARQELIERLMLKEKHQLSVENIMEIAQLSEGYSGADIRNLCADASMGPIRSLDMNLIHSIQTAEVRPINMNDCRLALSRVKSSVSPNDLDQYVVWNKTYGSGTLC